MPESPLLFTVTLGLGAALILGYLAKRVGLSPIVGYLLAGVLVSPATPGLAADRHLAEQLAEIGVILLMFGVGMHFHVGDLMAVRRVAVPGAVLQCAASAALGTGVAVLTGWGWRDAAVFGLALSVASTVVLTRVLSDRNALHTPVGRVAVGWLVVQDLLTVLVMVVLPPLMGGDGGAGGVVLALGAAVLKIGVLVALALPLGGRVVPWLLTRVSRTGSRELFTLAVLVAALGVAVGSAAGFGVSLALGAFLAGMVVGRSDFGLRAAADALPMRDAFAVLFFVSVGMRFDPRLLLAAPGLAAGAVLVVIVGTPVTAGLVGVLFRLPPRVALSVALALGQVGEFSFILADLTVDQAPAAVEPDTSEPDPARPAVTKRKLLPPVLMNALVIAAVVSISVSPLLFRLVGPTERWLARRPRVWRWLNARAGGDTGANPAKKTAADPRYRAVVVGYGPVGRTAVRLLRENGVEPTVVELNADTVRELRADGVAAVYGDASHADTLKEAGVGRAATLVLSSSGMDGAAEVVRLARELRPGVRVIARAGYLRERAALRAAGADEVYAGEGEVALAMTESVLRVLGATAEQVDRERERVRADLFGAPAADSRPVPSEAGPPQ